MYQISIYSAMTSVCRYLLFSRTYKVGLQKINCHKMSNNVPGVHSILYVTAPTEDVAKNLAHEIIKNQLAACVNVIPKITSVYMWKGEVTEDGEALMMIKTKTTKVSDITNFIKDRHPYELCEVISLPIENGNPKYLDWISEVVKP